ncbi:hypothetical protein VD0002_g10028 [Verticillium dahliae]|uniref:Mid2 domain-containing protein n=1 Tax=Verticillium dahliae TaxID=27337 RepID=A0AA45AS02_VERDA|nr:hypothetical protein EV126DRAFT_443157 [Verticillium dahliae]PNH36628.1 hypothetical protein BJF96_g585 [Verticillium dahliae]PNH41619.1 hypothetical protein VD0003_g9944 [Verticillium dahliae]PNH54062.1 hypothetical protein VD0002_g10028 [Verticillium dahliae]
MRHRRIGPLAGAGLGLGLVAIASGQTQCFFPNGTDALRTNPNGDFFPCKYPGFGMCCASLDDRCLGVLCWSSTTNGLYRGGCTDATWESEECLHLCTGGGYLEGDETKTPMDSRNVPVTQCTDGRYCCGNRTDARSCCDGGGGFYVNGTTIRAAEGYSSNSSSPVSSATSKGAGPATSTRAVTDGQQTGPAEDEGLESGVIVGAAVGGALGTLLVSLALLGVFFWRRKKRRLAAGQIDLDTATTSASSGKAPDVHEAPSATDTITGEMSANDGVVEILGASRAELPGNHCYELDSKPINREKRAWSFSTNGSSENNADGSR